MVWSKEGGQADNSCRRPRIPSVEPAMLTRIILTAALAIPVSSFGTPPWDKAPEKWDRADAYRILQDSPWSPAQVKLDTRSTTRHTDSQTGRVTDNLSGPLDANPVGGLEVSRGKELPPIPVLWWSSRMVRLAQQRILQLRSPASARPLDAPNLPDYVLAIEGNEPQRILQDAAEDLHDTVFLELPEGVTLDLESARFVDGTDDQDARTEFHFPREVDGRPTIDPDTEHIIFHCHASAKTSRPNRNSAISLRAEFKPRTMRARNLPDL
jgi:hypothetical protein